MRLGGRLAAAIDILADIDARSRPVADALRDWGLSHRFAGSGDRAAIGNLVYDALRARLSHAFLMDGDRPEMLAYAVLFRQWGISPEGLAAEFEGDRFAPRLLPAETLTAWRTRDLSDAPPHVQADVPQWAAPRLEASFGDGWIAEAAALGERPPLDLRVNTLKAAVGKVEKALARTGAKPSCIARDGLRIPAGSGPDRLPNVTADPAFTRGWFEVQDEGSQIVSELTGAREGEQVLDFCAGGGGKTLAMAALMQNKGQIHAYDADRKRLAPIIERLRRAGTRNVQVHPDAAMLEPLTGRCDRVLVDAPCTGSGTWRRRPETKWRLTERSLVERIDQQRAVLAEAARYVRPGGTLVYVTCSVFPEENAGQVESFLAGNPAFAPVALPAAWSETYGPEKPAPRSPEGTSLLLSPARTGTDGFFIALLQRSTS